MLRQRFSLNLKLKSTYFNSGNGVFAHSDLLNVIYMADPTNNLVRIYDITYKDAVQQLASIPASGVQEVVSAGGGNYVIVAKGGKTFNYF